VSKSVAASPAAGQYRLVVRATDGTGQIQPPVDADQVPDGATVFHHISVRVN
jgi:hypothetical protein